MPLSIHLHIPNQPATFCATSIRRAVDAVFTHPLPQSLAFFTSRFSIHRMLPLLFALSAFTAAPALAAVERDFYDVHTHTRYALTPREYITPETRLDSYDYIIAGGGLAGLVLASKLSADGNTTVLVLEAGGTGDEKRDIIGMFPTSERRGSVPHDNQYRPPWIDLLDFDSQWGI